MGQPDRPLHFLVAGGARGAPAWISLVLRSTVRVKLVKQAGVSAFSSHGITRICALASGEPPVRAIGFQVAFVPQPAPPVKRPYSNPTTTAGGAPGEHERFVSSLLGRSLSAGRPGMRRPARR